jgi:hypothetical protein
MRPSTNLQVFASFWPQKMLQPFITLLYSPDLSPPDYFLFPKLKMMLKGLHFADVAKIQDSVTDELNKAQKENFRQLFRNFTTAQKYVYMPMELILNNKIYVSYVFDL